MGLIGFTTHLNTKVTEQLGEGVLREPVMVVLLIRRRVVPHIFFFCAVGSTRKRTHPRVVLVVTDSLLAVNLCQPLFVCVCLCVCVEPVVRARNCGIHLLKNQCAQLLGHAMRNPEVQLVREVSVAHSRKLVQRVGHFDEVFTRFLLLAN